MHVSECILFQPGLQSSGRSGNGKSYEPAKIFCPTEPDQSHISFYPGSICLQNLAEESRLEKPRVTFQVRSITILCLPSNNILLYFTKAKEGFLHRTWSRNEILAGFGIICLEWMHYKVSQRRKKVALLSV